MFGLIHILSPPAGTFEPGEAVKYVLRVPGGDGIAAVSTAIASGRSEEASNSSRGPGSDDRSERSRLRCGRPVPWPERSRPPAVAD